MAYYSSSIQYHLGKKDVRRVFQGVGRTYHSVSIHDGVEAMSDNKDGRVGWQLIPECRLDNDVRLMIWAFLLASNQSSQSNRTNG